MDLVKMQAEMKARMLRERRVARQVAAEAAADVLPPSPPVPVKSAAPVELQRNKSVLQDRCFHKGSVFYVINVLPRDGKRYKFGYTDNIQNRIDQHHTLAPDCLLVRTYPCHPENERYVLRRLRCWPGVLAQSIEVFDINDPRQVVRKIDALFAEKNMLEPQNA